MVPRGGVVTVAALFVASAGAYFGLDDVDPWDEARDARLYEGPHPVVAHPPCSSWCQLAPVLEARWGLKRGDDGGCFASALASVRRFGGVLEHPALSYAWPAFGLPKPEARGWSRGFCGGWVCRVFQGNYGHRARKDTWLYVFGARYLPAVAWEDPGRSAAIVSRFRNRGSDDRRPRLSSKQAKATPPAFRELLLEIARSAVVS